jgi:hypothetical protein
MNVKRFVSAGAIALATVGCGYSIRTASDYDKTVNFSSLRSFSIVKGNSSGNPLMDERAAADVKSALTAKGWRELPSSEAQTSVVVHAATKTKHTYQTLYDGFGGGWRGWGGYRGFGGSSTTYVENYKVGTVVVDIFDAPTKQAIDKMFVSFPPGSAAAGGR